ncbi:MAG: hypothetical protein K2L89_01925 [Muribaculaceae bacterium]|nr:hypothetical protein [Muribaculaceae bacterium]
MKKIGSVAEFGLQRNEELWLAYRRAIASSGVVSTDILYEMTAESPTSRFWVSERRASEVIGAMLRGISISFMTPLRQQMFKEIFSRFLSYREKFPKSTIYEATFNAVNSPAPKFYLTPKTVKILLYKIRKLKGCK